MPDIPLHFQLDQHGDLYNELANNTQETLIDIFCEASGQGWAAPIEGCAELIVPDSETQESQLAIEAFCVAGYIACYSLYYSDAPEDLKKNTLKHMSLTAMPVSILHGSQPLVGMSQIAREGHASHPELQQHTELIENFYRASSEERIARIASCGAGVALYQLENAWTKARNVYIERVSAEMTQDMDWDTLPWAGAGE